MNRRTASPVARRRPSPHRDHCPMSGKVRYRDAREATDALHALTNQATRADQLGGRHTIRVQRKYQCNACRGWHLTSRATWGADAGARPDSLPAPDDPFARYGSDAEALRQLIAGDPSLAGPLHPALPYRKVEIIWSVRNEMAETLADVLSRRLRALVLDTRAALEIAPLTAAVMAKELGKNREWASGQVAQFRKLARGYLL